MAEHHGRPRVERNKPGEQTKQGCLPGAVATRQQDDLTLEHVEVNTSQGGEAAEKAHGRTQADDGLHSVSGEQVS